jgi:hypothetical protein
MPRNFITGLGDRLTISISEIRSYFIGFIIIVKINVNWRGQFMSKVMMRKK